MTDLGQTSIRPLLQRDRNAARLGVVVERDEPGEAVLSMVVRDDMLNGFDMTQGGVVFSFADTAFALACNEDEHVTVAAGADIVFVKSSGLGQRLTAHARRVARTGRTGLYDVTVTDETGDVVAEFRGRSATTRRLVTDPPG